MTRETETGISRMLEIIEEIGATKGNYNISGSGTQVGFGRGGVPPNVEIINYVGQQRRRDISGVAAAVGFAIPELVKIIKKKREQ